MISLLMPVKNEATFLPQVLKSISNQSEKDFEAIVVNDHCNDNSQQILQQHAQSDGRFKLFINTGHGTIDALQTAYAQAQGDYITRQDADDPMPPKKLERLLAYSKTTGLATWPQG